MSNQGKNILSGGPEGLAANKRITAIPEGDDVEGHGNNGKNILSGGPEGLAANKRITAIPDSEDDDVEGHGASKKIV